MIELSPLEQAVLDGKHTDKARAALQKTEQDAAKIAEREALAALKTQQQLNDQADERVRVVEQQIVGDTVKLLEPLTDYTPSYDLLNKHALVSNFSHQQQQAEIAGQRQALEQALADINQRAADLEVEKASLANAVRLNGQDLESLGRIGVIIMDLNVLAGVRQKYQEALSGLPMIGTDIGEQNWLNSVKTAKETALINLIKACEGVVCAAIAKLYELDAAKYTNYIHVMRVVRGERIKL